MAWTIHWTLNCFFSAQTRLHPGNDHHYRSLFVKDGLIEKVSSTIFHTTEASIEKFEIALMDSAGADSREATNINKSDIALTYFRMLVNKFSLTLAMEAARLMFSQSTQTQQHREHGWRGSVSNLGCLMEFSLRLPKRSSCDRNENHRKVKWEISGGLFVKCRARRGNQSQKFNYSWWIRWWRWRCEKSIQLRIQNVINARDAAGALSNASTVQVSSEKSH